MASRASLFRDIVKKYDEEKLKDSEQAKRTELRRKVEAKKGDQ